MLTVVRSPEPWLPLDAAAWPADAAELLAILSQQPERCHWATANAGRRRAVEAHGAAGPATLLPHVHSLDAFALRLGLRAGGRPTIRHAERLVRLSQAWYHITSSPAGPALLQQLDRFVGDWQLSALAPPSRPADVFESVVQHYLRDLDADGLHDEPAHLAALVHELSIEATPLPSALAGARLIIFDGFLRLDVLRLRLITELSRRIEVLVWLPALEEGLAEEMLATLRRRRVPLRVIEPVPTSNSAFAQVGRSLFSPAPASPGTAVAGLIKLEAATAREEVEQVARRIKGDVRAVESGTPLSLRDIAIVVPDEAYAPLVAEVLPRHGLAVDDSGMTTRVSHTRSFRLLTSAWQVLRGPWRYEAVRDFLVQPAVRCQLQDPERLDYFFEHRPRARQQRTSATWLDAWQRLARHASDRLAGMESGSLEINARDAAERERRLAEQRALAAGLGRLLESIRRVLQPIIAMEAILEGQASSPGALPALAHACLDLFDVLAMPDWLAHPQTNPRDVQGFDLLTSALRFLSESPRHRARASSLWQPDPLETLRGVLESLVFPSAPACEGVRVHRLEEGARAARHVYVLGLQEGVQPASAEADALLPARVRNTTLRSQLRQRESATRAQFRALFGLSRERLVLSRPVQTEDDRTRPSPFLQAVEACVSLPHLESRHDITCVREASRVLGRAFASRGSEPGEVAELWPTAGNHGLLANLSDRLRDWHGRDGWPRRNHLDARALLALRFPNDLAFSASDLETYAACPFRYFSQRVLGLQERDADQARTHYGSLVHRVLQAFYDEQRESGVSAAGEPLPPISAAHAPRLRELFEREWRRLGEGVIPPDLRTLFTSEQGVLQLFLDAMAKLEGQHGNLRNEFAVENVPLGEDAAGRPVLVSGRIDRIDRHRQSEQAIILDYKTGRSARPAERKAKTEDGRLLQLPLYAAALSIDQGMPVVGGAYVHLHDRAARVEQAIETAGELTWNGARAVDVPFDPEAARRKAIELAGRIRNGDFSLTAHVHGQPHSECSSFCPLRHACRSPEGYKTISL